MKWHFNLKGHKYCLNMANADHVITWQLIFMWYLCDYEINIWLFCLPNSTAVYQLITFRSAQCNYTLIHESLYIFCHYFLFTFNSTKLPQVRSPPFLFSILTPWHGCHSSTEEKERRNLGGFLGCSTSYIQCAMYSGSARISCSAM